jgi:hypothetical protein
LHPISWPSNWCHEPYSEQESKSRIRNLMVISLPFRRKSPVHILPKFQETCAVGLPEILSRLKEVWIEDIASSFLFIFSRHQKHFPTHRLPDYFPFNWWNHRLGNCTCRSVRAFRAWTKTPRSKLQITVYRFFHNWDSVHTFFANRTNNNPRTNTPNWMSVIG